MADKARWQEAAQKSVLSAATLRVLVIFVSQAVEVDHDLHTVYARSCQMIEAACMMHGRQSAWHACLPTYSQLCYLLRWTRIQAHAVTRVVLPCEAIFSKPCRCISAGGNAGAGPRLRCG